MTASTLHWGNLTRAIERARNGSRVVICHPDRFDEVCEVVLAVTGLEYGPIAVRESVHVSAEVVLIATGDHADLPRLVTVQPDPCETLGMWGRCSLRLGHSDKCQCPSMPEPFED